MTGNGNGQTNGQQPIASTGNGSTRPSTVPLRYCAVPGCPTKVSSGRCDVHKQAAKQEYGRFSKGRYGRPWRRAVAEWIAEDPDVRAYCAHCMSQGKTALGEETDHIIPHRGNNDLYWDRNNWQRLCRACHAAKTSREIRCR